MRTVKENSEQGLRTLFLCFYAGHAEHGDEGTNAYLNCGPRDGSHGCELVAELAAAADHKGSYLIALMACDSSRRPQEQQRGGTEATEPKIIGMGQ